MLLPECTPSSLGERAQIPTGIQLSERGLRQLWGFFCRSQTCPQKLLRSLPQSILGPGKLDSWSSFPSPQERHTAPELRAEMFIIIMLGPELHRACPPHSDTAYVQGQRGGGDVSWKWRRLGLGGRPRMNFRNTGELLKSVACISQGSKPMVHAPVSQCSFLHISKDIKNFKALATGR